MSLDISDNTSIRTLSRGGSSTLSKAGGGGGGGRGGGGYNRIRPCSLGVIANVMSDQHCSCVTSPYHTQPTINNKLTCHHLYVD